MTAPASCLDAHITDDSDSDDASQGAGAHACAASDGAVPSSTVKDPLHTTSAAPTNLASAVDTCPLSDGELSPGEILPDVATNTPAATQREVGAMPIIHPSSAAGVQGGGATSDNAVHLVVDGVQDSTAGVNVAVVARAEGSHDGDGSGSAGSDDAGSAPAPTTPTAAQVDAPADDGAGVRSSSEPGAHTTASAATGDGSSANSSPAANVNANDEGSTTVAGSGNVRATEGTDPGADLSGPSDDEYEYLESARPRVRALPRQPPTPPTRTHGLAASRLPSAPMAALYETPFLDDLREFNRQANWVTPFPRATRRRSRAVYEDAGAGVGAGAGAGAGSGAGEVHGGGLSAASVAAALRRARARLTAAAGLAGLGRRIASSFSPTRSTSTTRGGRVPGLGEARPRATVTGNGTTLEVPNAVLAGEMDEMVVSVSQALNIHPHIGASMLVAANWVADDVVVGWGSEEATGPVTREAFPRLTASETFDKWLASKEETAECDVCLEEMPVTCTFSLACGHSFCSGCWREAFSECADDASAVRRCGAALRTPVFVVLTTAASQALNMTCLDGDCPVRVDELTWNALADLEVMRPALVVPATPCSRTMCASPGGSEVPRAPDQALC